MDKVQVPILQQGQIFSSKADLLDYVQTVAIVTHCSFQTIKSDTTRLSLICQQHELQQCPWRLYASAIPDNKFAIKTLCENHMCTGDKGLQSAQATSQWVANRIEGQLRNQPLHLYNNKAIWSDIQQRYGIKVSSGIAAGAKRIALRQIYSAIEQGYQQLPQYASMIEQTNPGSLSKVVVDGDRRFSGFFVAYACHLHGADLSSFLTEGLSKNLTEDKY